MYDAGMLAMEKWVMDWTERDAQEGSIGCHTVSVTDYKQTGSSGLKQNQIVALSL